ncbi:MAG: ABC transporter ATP-binding protein [Verrucomicrobiae bacterium]|nr:ABC transporter ATP-binding protein [Verrucomicrobiae bacterium]
MHAVETKDLTKHFRVGLKRTVIALDHLNLQVREGEVYGLLGPNGSGKSTTLKLILGLFQPTEGEATIFGRSAETVASRLEVGLLPENPYFYRYLNGEETLRFYGKLCRVTGKRLDERVAEILELVGLSDSRHRRLSGYSKGMLQRIGLAQALINDPKLLLLDEPTAGVDPEGSMHIRDLIVKLKTMGKTVILCSHLLSQVQDVCDRISILRYGKMVLEGDVHELLARQDQWQFIAAGLSVPAKEEVKDFIAKRGTLVSASHPESTLEELYMRSVGGNKIK